MKVNVFLMNFELIVVVMVKQVREKRRLCNNSEGDGRRPPNHGRSRRQVKSTSSSLIGVSL